MVGCEGDVWVCGLGWHCDFIFTGMVNKTDSSTNDETGMYLGRRRKTDRDCVRDTTSICGSITLFEILSFAGHQIHHRGDTTQPTNMWLSAMVCFRSTIATKATTKTGATHNANDDDNCNDGDDDNGTDVDGGKKLRRRTVVFCGTKSSTFQVIRSLTVVCYVGIDGLDRNVLISVFGPVRGYKHFFADIFMAVHLLHGEAGKRPKRSVRAFKNPVFTAFELLY